ncbi:MAG: hypothetical protein Q4F84_08335, partial [Fibrobacter sp.]|nr:hypothetical protein [Fibrobacter sp.]
MALDALKGQLQVKIAQRDETQNSVNSKQGEVSVNEGAQGTNRGEQTTAVGGQTQAQNTANQTQSEISNLEASKDNVAMIVTVDEETGDQIETQDFAALSTIDQQIQGLEIKLDTSNNDIATYSTQISQLDNDFGALQTQYTALSDEEAQLAAQYTLLDGECSELEGEITVLEQEEIDAQIKAQEEADAKAAEEAKLAEAKAAEEAEMQAKIEEKSVHAVQNNTGHDTYVQAQLDAKKAINPDYKGDLNTEREIYVKNNGFELLKDPEGNLIKDKNGNTTVKSPLLAGTTVVLEGQGLENGEKPAWEKQDTKASAAAYAEGQEYVAKKEAEAKAEAEAKKATEAEAKIKSTEVQKTSVPSKSKNSIGGFELPNEGRALPDIINGAIIGFSPIGDAYAFSNASKTIIGTFENPTPENRKAAVVDTWEAFVGLLGPGGVVISAIGLENIANGKALHDEDFKNG